MLRFLAWGGIFVGAMSAAAIAYGVREKGLAAASSATPEKMSLEQLIARGPAGNPNVVLTDFATCDNFIYEKKKGRWTAAWLPIVPKGAAAGKGGSPAAFKAIIYSSRAKSEEELYRRCDQPQLRGMVVNTIRSLDSGDKRLLAESYPQTDFSTCIIFEEGKEPASEGLTSVMIFGGIGGIVLALGLLGLGWFLWRQQSAQDARRAKGRRKGPLRGDEDDEDDRARRRRPVRDDEDDDRPSRRRAVADEDDDRPRKRRPVEDDEGERPRRRVARDDDEDRPRRRRPIDDEDDDRTRRRPRRDD